MTDPILDIQKRWLDSLRLPHPPVVIDVGANTGRFAEEVLERWPEAHVVCFEPNPACFELIKTSAEVRPIALGDMGGSAHLHTGTGPDTTASLYRRFDWPADGVRVPIARLDEQWADHIDLLKVDAEGHELAILRGMGDLRPSIIQLEWNSCQRDAGSTYAGFREVLADYDIHEIMQDGGTRRIVDDELEYDTHKELVAWYAC